MAENGFSFWIILKPILLILVPLIILLSFLPGPDGNPIMPLRDWLPDTVSMTHLVNKIPGGKQVTGTQTQIYKWQDEDGQWHFSESAPELNLQKVEQITVTTEVNTIQAPPEPEQKNERQAPDLTQEFNLSDLPKVIENAQKAKEMMNQRAKESEGL